MLAATLAFGARRLAGAARVTDRLVAKLRAGDVRLQRASAHARTRMTAPPPAVTVESTAPADVTIAAPALADATIVAAPVVPVPPPLRAALPRPSSPLLRAPLPPPPPKLRSPLRNDEWTVALPASEVTKREARATSDEKKDLLA